MTSLIIIGLSLKRLLVSLDTLTTKAAAGTLVKPTVSAEAGRSGGGQKKTQQKKKTYRTTVCVKIYLPRAFNVSEEIWAHLGRRRPGLSRRTRDCTSADVQRGNKIKGYQRNPVIARRLTVSPASKRRHLFCVLISSRCCGLLSRCACSTRLAGGLGGWRGLWLHQHPLGEALWLPQDNETYLKSSTGAGIDYSLQRLTHKTISSIFTQGRAGRCLKAPCVRFSHT